MKNFSIPFHCSLWVKTFTFFFVVVVAHKFAERGLNKYLRFHQRDWRSAKKWQTRRSSIWAHRNWTKLNSMSNVNTNKYFSILRCESLGVVPISFLCLRLTHFLLPPPVRKHFFLFNSLIHLQMTSGGDSLAVGGWDFDGKKESACSEV